ncbi:Zn-dependent oligopeptidase [Nocardioides panacis]|uniref:Zn-dependent oligopeptidase n=1 Tax=Nocardioides panacis TaxID=2849501 RepID=A0A975XYP3_9ACTN|nr:M3 family metallopeptidase [Nocardioides panacis]QWZ06590.1 Zn-dependent oligopeptidase [Nocardioides panacis]
MTVAPAPLALPDSAWEDWVATRCDGRLAETRRLVEELRAGGHTSAEAMALWNDLNLALHNAFSTASLVSNVHPEEAVRTRAERAEQDAHKLLTEIGLDRPLYDVLAAVDPADLDEGGRRVHALAIRDFRRAGVDQTDDVRSRLRELAERETTVAQEFSKNIRDDVRSVRVEAAALDGLPADFVEAHPPGEDGLVEITTAYPDYVPFMTFCRDREARAALVGEFLNRAYPQNDPLLHELLGLRREHAQLLGYDGWPSYDAEVKMIGKGSAIPEFIERITEASDAAGHRDAGVLLRRLQQDHPEVEQVTAVDRMFYAEVLRRETFDVDAQQVRPYFDFARVRAGLLAVTGRLFDVEYVEVPGAASWHEDVATYDVVRGGARLGRIHLDLHPRTGKYGHAAQFDLAPGIRDRQVAEGVLVCNFSRNVMEHDHVVTLFHEFGHLVHHVLAGNHRWTRFAGVATEWDFVEAPSQMLEEWAWDADVLRSFATNADGDPIPRELVAKMRAAKEFGKGTHVRTQMFYAALSYTLHQDVPDDITATLRELQERYDVFGYVPDTHFYASFGHLEGYGSGYYTYMWSLVIAKDLFSAFDRDDLFATEVAHRYRDRVLAPGGSRDAADLVADFLGRPYGFEAFQRWLDRV